VAGGSGLQELKTFVNPKVVLPGVLILQGNKFENYEKAQKEFEDLNTELKQKNIDLSGFPMIVICDDSNFTSEKLNNFLWSTFTRCNPSHDIYGVNPFTKFKHFGCNNVILDARIKPHHAPPLEKIPEIEKRVDRLFIKGASLEKLK
ncbi:MAG TPA: 3-octaprenyl-4-hydroxybenzoate carboxy-lyase, partial [Bacteroidia bacterium]|nr:3-octaprenyl-4-hydroxybenzoate carboxy-lyase [Bacteroidia bacterium]